MTDFEFIVLHPSGRSTRRGSLADCHVWLGVVAQQRGLNIHVHEGEWDSSSFSVAHKGDEPLFYVEALVRKV